MTTPSNTQRVPTPATAIDPATTVGLLSLTVSDLARSITFYTRALGFELLDRADSTVTLGAAGAPLLLLQELPGARPWPGNRPGYTGLYHFAILLPSRPDLGRWLRHWLEHGLPLPGQGDHLVSEALYLEDPDGNGIEVYRDRPRAEWPRVNGKIRMASDPVDIQGLLTEAKRTGTPWAGLPAGTRLGHMHLQVGDLAQAAAFYAQILGFEIMVAMPTALFVAAGGYHHHLGLNTWHSLGAGPAPEGTAGLRFFTIDLPSDEALQAVIARLDAAGVTHSREGNIVAVEDPWRNTILLQVGSAGNPLGDARAAAALTALDSGFFV